jgi:hypothetical protein
MGVNEGRRKKAEGLSGKWEEGRPKWEGRRGKTQQERRKRRKRKGKEKFFLPLPIFISHC